MLTTNIGTVIGKEPDVLVVAKSSADYRHGGRVAGDIAGREFREGYPLGGAADPAMYTPALQRAMDQARYEMREAGATERQVDIWTSAFFRALEPHIKAWEAERAAHLDAVREMVSEYESKQHGQ